MCITYETPWGCFEDHFDALPLLNRQGPRQPEKLSTIYFRLKQCFGSGYIRIDFALLDPDLYWECGSGSRSKEIDYN
jgi:hypothetical protein